MRTALAVATSLLCVLALASTAGGYPPITCGRMSVRGTTYIVRSHGPTCTFAERSLRTFLVRHRAPRHYRCRAYGAQVPAYCKNALHRYRFRYFFVNPAS